MPKRLFLLAGLVLLMSSAVATADDKDLLKAGSAPPNILIVFGNSQTTEQPILGSASAWDGDADSAFSKMGAAKQVLQRFINAKSSTFNIGMTSFSHNPNAGSITISGKHWLYSPLSVDFPNQTWKEPIGTIERWGPNGEGPCYGTGGTVPACADRSPAYVNLPAGAAFEAGTTFFGSQGAGTAYICLDGTKCNDGNKDNATKRIQVTLTMGKYGDAFTDGTLSTYTIASTHSMEVHKVYQIKSGSNWGTGTLSGGDSPTVTVNYVPSLTLTKPDLFYTADLTFPSDAGKAVGFLNDPKGDINVNANCSGWEFQKSNASTNPLIKIPRDYKWGATCAPPQNSLPCALRLLRPQAKLVHYDQGSGAFATTDPDNPGYTGSGSMDQDGCDPTLRGAVDIGLDITENQAIMITRNGSQAPIKNLLQNIYDYFTKSSIDGFQNGKRADDPNKACRTSSVILIYDNFNGCQNDTCSVLTSQVLTPLKQIGINGVKVFVIGFGESATATSSTGVCIAQNTGAILGGKPGYFPVTDADQLFKALNDIASSLDEATQTFATSAVSTSQAQGDQMAYFASFGATKNRSIWNGRLGGYALDVNGNVQLGLFTTQDKTDPAFQVAIPVPSNASSSLIWNAAENLRGTDGTGATDSTRILKPGDGISTGSYPDDTNDSVNPNAPTFFYRGRKIVFSLPKSNPNPTTLPIPAENTVPENRYDMTFNTGAGWWPSLRALLGPQTAPPLVRNPPLDDTDAASPKPNPENSDAAKTLRFIWGDRDAVTGATDPAYQYLGLKLGDVFHSSPLLVGNPADFALFKTNTQGYQTFFNTYKNRRRILYVGANDGLLHAFEAGVWDRTPSVCPAGHCYDLGTGAELFAFAPRAIMQIYKPLKDAVGSQTKQDEWTVDLSPSAADVFIDAGHSGTPVSGNRAWHTVLVGGVREGSPFEGTSGASPSDSQGSYYALDITQPDEIVSGVEVSGTSAAPACLNKSGSCARDWPTVLWEITDSCGSPCTSATGDLDVSPSPGFGYPDMGETWAKASMGRVKVCLSSCATTSPVNEDHYVAIFGGGFDRERLNRRGNWLYMVDIETGKTLYKANSSCGGDPIVGSGCVYFGSIPSEPAALDYDGDGYLDVIYVGDQKGQLWRIDLTDLRMASSWPPSNRFRNQLNLASGTGKPFLFFQATQPTAPATTPFYPIYFRPEAINLGYNSGGKPALGIAFGTGDRDDIRATVDPSSLTYPQRFYYIVDAANSTTMTESNLHPIPSSIDPVASTDPLLVNGWFLKLSSCPVALVSGSCPVALVNGERVVGDSLTAGGIIRFPTYSPISSTPGSDACANTSKCTSSAGTSRLYQVFYNNGNAYPLGATDRGQVQPNAMFITAETSYISGLGDAHGIYWSGGAKNPSLGVGKKITVRSWKEKSSSP